MKSLFSPNDLEQTLARVFRTMEGIIQHNPELQAEAEVQSKAIYLDNGTTVTAISGDYQGAVGSNHGWISYDELWAYTSESSRRLFEGLTPVPTRKNSVRFITTYAGFEGESATTATVLSWRIIRSGSQRLASRSTWRQVSSSI